MRWAFPDPSEDAKRQRIERAMDAFFAALAKKQGDLDAMFSGGKRWDLPAFMQKHLGAIDERLMWEFGPALKGSGHRLAITAEGERALVPLVNAMLARAPKLRGLELYGERPAEALDYVGPTVQGRTGHPMPDGRVLVAVTDRNAFELTYFLDGCSGPDDERAQAAAVVATEVLLGETTMYRWVSSIGVDKPSRKKALVAIGDLPRTIKQAIGDVRGALPKKPFRLRVKKATWSLLKLEPKRAKDYPQQLDQFTAVAMEVPLFAATRMPFFASERFSRMDEVFAYVKIDGSNGLAGSTFGDREEIESAIAEALGDHGAVIGGGTGLRYSYVELALEDAKKGVERVCRVLRGGRIPLRTFIQFHDEELQNEWLGVYPETPKPPGVE